MERWYTDKGRVMVEKWQNKLGLQEWTIKTKRIKPQQVVYPDDCTGGERFFIGVEKNHETLTATIYHDVPLYEEAVIHELLHVKYPTESEEWINNKTEQICKVEKKS